MLLLLLLPLLGKEDFWLGGKGSTRRFLRTPFAEVFVR
jgi:hypothetical protein